MVITDSFTLEDVRLYVNISHTYIQDLVITLTSPAGTEVTVFNRNCGGQDDLNVTFADGEPPIACNDLNSGGTYQPVNPLSAFIGENVNGTWTLNVSDHYSQDTGTLNSWALMPCHTLGMEEENQISNLHIYPVPASGIIHIGFDPKSKEQTVTITDLNGRIIAADTYHYRDYADITYDTGSWAKGIYLIKITDGQAQSVRKIIVK